MDSYTVNISSFGLEYDVEVVNTPYVFDVTHTGGTRGPVGTDGTDGSSAYEIAVSNGYTGTEAEWLESLAFDSSNYLPLSGGVLPGNLTITGSISANEYLGLSIPSGEYLPLSGGTITGNLNVAGDLITNSIKPSFVLSNTTHYDGFGNPIFSVGSNAFQGIAPTYIDNTFDVKFGAFHVDDISENTGIGTGTPSAKLHVNGDAIIEDDLNVDGVISTYSSSAPSSSVKIRQYIDADPSNPTVSAGFLDLNSGFLRLYVGNSVNKVHRLDLRNVTNLDYVPSVTLKEGTLNGVNNITFVKTDQGKSPLALVSASAFGEICGEVGTISPAGHRSLNFNTWSSSSDRYAVEGQYVFDTKNAAINWTAGQHHTAWKIADVYIGVIDSIGQFGIGTDSPSAKLHVNGDSIIEDDLVANGTENTMPNQTLDGGDASVLTYGIAKQYDPLAYSTLTAPAANVGYLPFGFGRIDGTYTYNWGTDNSPAYFLPFMIRGEFTKCSFYHSAGTHPTAVMEVAVYNVGNDGKPTTLVDQQTIALDSIGRKTVTFSSPIAISGLFYVAIRCSIGKTQWDATGGSGVLSVKGYGNGSNAFLSQILGSVDPSSFDTYDGTMIARYSSYTHPFPADLTNDSSVTFTQIADSAIYTVLLHS